MDEFDWSPLGEGFWTSVQQTTGASDAQTKFACAHHRGLTQTAAAREAGYSGSDETLRQAGHRASRSNAVIAMMQIAAAEAKGGEDGTVGVGEARRILSKLARGSDPNVRIKALESLARLEDRQSDRAPEVDLLDDEFLRIFMGVVRPEARPIIWAEMGLLKTRWFTPFINEFVPWLKANRPTYWAEVRKIMSPLGQQKDDIDGLEAMPVLSLDELCSLTKSKYLNHGESDAGSDLDRADDRQTGSARSA